MYNARSLRCLGSLFNRPSPRLLFARCQEGYQSEEGVALSYQRVQSALLKSEFLQKHRALFRLHLCKFLFGLCTYDKHFAALFGGDLFHFDNEGNVVLFLAHVKFRYVGGIDNGLCRQQEQVVQKGLFGL